MTFEWPGFQWIWFSQIIESAWIQCLRTDSFKFNISKQHFIPTWYSGQFCNCKILYISSHPLFVNTLTFINGTSKLVVFEKDTFIKYMSLIYDSISEYIM